MSEEEKEIEIINKIRDSITDNENIYLLCDSLEDIIKNNKQSYDIQIVVNSLLNYIDKLQKENDKLKQDNYNLDRENQLKFDKIIKENVELKKEIDNLIKENHKHIDYIASMKKKHEDKIKNKIKEITEETQYFGIDKGETKQHYAIKRLKELLGDDKDE